MLVIVKVRVVFMFGVRREEWKNIIRRKKTLKPKVVGNNAHYARRGDGMVFCVGCH